MAFGVYSVGTVSVTAASTTVTGDGTAWALVAPYGGVVNVAGLSVPIADDGVVSNSEITLAYGWPGETLEDQPYALLLGDPQTAGLATTIETRRQLNVLDANGRGLFYNLIAVTGDNDPGPGNLALNNSTPETVTQAYLDVLDANGGGGRDVAGIIDLWTASTVIIIRSIASAAYAAYRLAGVPSLTGGYRRLELDYIDHSGTLGNEPIAIEYNRGGDNLRIDAAGTFAGRDAYDDEVDGFVYASVNGAGGFGAPTVLYRKNAPSGSWSAAVPFQGPTGAPANIEIGTVTTVNPGTPASVTITGTAPDFTLDYEIPKGSVVTFGSVTTLAPGEPAAATITPTAEGFRIDLSIPKGDTGDIDSVTAFWQTRVTSDTTAAEARAGLGSVGGPAGATSDNLALFDGTTGLLIKDSGFAFSSLGGAATRNIGTGAAEIPLNSYLGDLAFEDVAAIANGGSGAQTAVGAADNFSPDFATVASASTCNIGAASSPNVIISGTTTINSFGTKAAGVRRFVRFTGSLTLVHSGSLILPSSENLKTEAGDELVFVSLGSGNWKCTHFQPVLPYRVISSGSLPAANTMTLTNIPQKFSRLVLLISGMSFDTATRLAYLEHNNESGSGYAGQVAFGADTFSISNYLAQFGASQAIGETVSAIVDITDYQNGYFTRATGVGACRLGGTPLNFSSILTRLSTSATTSLRLRIDGSGSFFAGFHSLTGYF